MNKIRTFIAAKLDETLIQEISHLQSTLREAPGGRAVTWVRPESIHLTFKFLGDIEEVRLPDIYEAVQQACSRQQTFTILVSGLGCFPHINRPRVIWVGLQDDQHRAQRLQQDIEDELARRNYPREDRPFQPHLTLGRVRSSAQSSEVEAIGKTIATHPIGQLGILQVAQVHVIASSLTPSGAVYRTLSTSRLPSG